jgi:ketosteroid isomerase-like protein
MQENVDLVRRVYDLWNRGDIDGATEMFDPEVTALELEEQRLRG